MNLHESSRMKRFSRGGSEEGSADSLAADVVARTLFSMLPVVRAPVEMHHCEDEDPVAFDTIDHAVRKSSGKAAADVILQHWPHFGVSQDVANRFVDFYRKTLAESGLASLVVIDRLVKLCRCFGMERPIHRAKRCLTLAKSWSPGTDLTRPERKSASLRRAILAHAPSISASGGLRVRSRESTTIARSSTGKVAAS